MRHRLLFERALNGSSFHPKPERTRVGALFARLVITMMARSERDTGLNVNPRLELERAEALARSHDDEAAVTAARRVRLIAERTSDPALLEDAQLAIERFERGAREWRHSVERRQVLHERNEEKSLV
jgi:hypothetical protein